MAPFLTGQLISSKFRAPRSSTTVQSPLRQSSTSAAIRRHRRLSLHPGLSNFALRSSSPLSKSRGHGEPEARAQRPTDSGKDCPRVADDVVQTVKHFIKESIQPQRVQDDNEDQPLLEEDEVEEQATDDGTWSTTHSSEAFGERRSAEDDGLLTGPALPPPTGPRILYDRDDPTHRFRKRERIERQNIEMWSRRVREQEMSNHPPSSPAARSRNESSYDTNASKAVKANRRVLPTTTTSTFGPAFGRVFGDGTGGSGKLFDSPMYRQHGAKTDKGTPDVNYYLQRYYGLPGMTHPPLSEQALKAHQEFHRYLDEVKRAQCEENDLYASLGQRGVMPASATNYGYYGARSVEAEAARLREQHRDPPLCGSPRPEDYAESYLPWHSTPGIAVSSSQDHLERQPQLEEDWSIFGNYYDSIDDGLTGGRAQTSMPFSDDERFGKLPRIDSDATVSINNHDRLQPTDWSAEARRSQMAASNSQDFDHQRQTRARMETHHGYHGHTSGQSLIDHSRDAGAGRPAPQRGFQYSPFSLQRFHDLFNHERWAPSAASVALAPQRHARHGSSGTVILERAEQGSSRYQSPGQQQAWIDGAYHPAGHIDPIALSQKLSSVAVQGQPMTRETTASPRYTRAAATSDARPSPSPKRRYGQPEESQRMYGQHFMTTHSGADQSPRVFSSLPRTHSSLRHVSNAYDGDVSSSTRYSSTGDASWGYVQFNGVGTRVGVSDVEDRTTPGPLSYTPQGSATPHIPPRSSSSRRLVPLGSAMSYDGSYSSPYEASASSSASTRSVAQRAAWHTRNQSSLSLQSPSVLDHGFQPDHRQMRPTGKSRHGLNKAFATGGLLDSNLATLNCASQLAEHRFAAPSQANIQAAHDHHDQKSVFEPIASSDQRGNTLVASSAAHAAKPSFLQMRPMKSDATMRTASVLEPSPTEDISMGSLTPPGQDQQLESAAVGGRK